MVMSVRKKPALKVGQLDIPASSQLLHLANGSILKCLQKMHLRLTFKAVPSFVRLLLFLIFPPGVLCVPTRKKHMVNLFN